STGGDPARIHAGDVDGDGDDDIIGVSANADGTTGVTTWMSNRTATGGGNPGSSGAVFSALRTAVGDFDADGVIDLIAATPGTDAVTNFMVNFGRKGQVQFGGFVKVGSTGGNPARIHAGDVDGDGDDDIVGLSANADGTTNITTWMSNRTTVGGGNPGSSAAVFSSLRTTLGDFDGDGVADLIAAMPGAENVTDFKVNFGRKGSPTFAGFADVGGTAGNPTYLVNR
ncbi:MAG TPA: FG-GAP-like repeat-containing protein, partial [Actinoplanes sp.]|nr:FG-GAP-like repeat-containing protein [Actinoplanes sp.]